MAFGLLSGTPLSMLFSLLLMQGISLTMFRSLVNQAITRVDPLKFNLNLGNLGNTTTGTSTTQSPPLSPGAMPTPAPIIDPRVLDLITLIRAIQPGLDTQQQHQASAKLTTSVQQPSIIALPMVAAPTPVALQPTAANSALTASGLVASSSAAQIAPPPHIIIVPQLMKASASEKVEAQVLPTDEEEAIEPTEPTTIEPAEEEMPTTEAPKKNKTSKRRKKKKATPSSAKDSTIVFEAVGVHPTTQL